MVKEKNKVLGIFLVSLLVVAGVSAAFVFFDGENIFSGYAVKKSKSYEENKAKITGFYMDSKTNYLATVIGVGDKKTLITSPTQVDPTSVKNSLQVYHPGTVKQVTILLSNGEKKILIGGKKNKKGEITGGAEIKQDKSGKILQVKDKNGYTVKQEKGKDKIVFLDETGAFYMGAGLNKKEIKDYSKAYFKEKDAKEWAETVAAPSGFFTKLGSLAQSSSSKKKIDALTVEQKWSGLIQEFSIKGASTKEKKFFEKLMGYKKGEDEASQAQDSDCFCGQGSGGENFVDAALSLNPAEGGDLASVTNPGGGCGEQSGGSSMPSGSIMGSGGGLGLGSGMGSGQKAGGTGGSSAASSSKNDGVGCECTSGGGASAGSGKGDLCKGAGYSAAVGVSADCAGSAEEYQFQPTGSPGEGFAGEDSDGFAGEDVGNSKDAVSLGGVSADGTTAVELNYPNGPTYAGELKIYWEGTTNKGTKTWVEVSSGTAKPWGKGPLVAAVEVTGPKKGHAPAQDANGKWVDKTKEVGPDGKQTTKPGTTEVKGALVSKEAYGKAGPKLESDDVKGGYGKIDNPAVEKNQENIIEFKSGASGETGGECDPDKGECTGLYDPSGNGGVPIMGAAGDPCQAPQMSGSLCDNSWAYSKLVGFTDPSPIETTTLTGIASIEIDGTSGFTCFKGGGIEPKLIAISGGGLIMPVATPKDTLSQTK